jgi:hypothetical protein
MMRPDTALDETISRADEAGLSQNQIWLDARQTRNFPACDLAHMRRGRALLANTQVASSGGQTWRLQ